MSTQVPAELKFAKTHEWVRLNADVATIGISDHAQHELTDVVFAELPQVGRHVKAGEACAVVESVKTASDIYAPVSGQVVAVNAELVKHPELVNSSPYDQGWFFQVKMAQPSELDQLLAADAYRKQIEG